MDSLLASITDLCCLWGDGSMGPDPTLGALSRTSGAPFSLFCFHHSVAGHRPASGREQSRAKGPDPPVLGISSWSDSNQYRSKDPGDKERVR